VNAGVSDRTVTFARTVSKPWGHEIVFTSAELPYTGKMLAVSAGKRLSLQVHDLKLETVMLVSGTAVLHLESEEGVVEALQMQLGLGYTVWPGRRHRIEAVTDAILVEASTPEEGTTYRLDDDYNRPDERLR
jgi:mannose-6-phosphate isomerase-like protein (cupin superfamily)